jgi:hypothetical protein
MARGPGHVGARLGQTRQGGPTVTGGLVGISTASHHPGQAGRHGADREAPAASWPWTGLPPTHLGTFDGDNIVWGTIAEDTDNIV